MPGCPQCRHVGRCIPIIQILGSRDLPLVTPPDHGAEGAGGHRLLAFSTSATTGERGAHVMRLQVRNPGSPGPPGPDCPLSLLHPLPRRLPAGRGPDLPSPAAVGPSSGVASPRRGSPAPRHPAYLIRHASGCYVTGSGRMRGLPGAVFHRGDWQARPRCLPGHNGAGDAPPPSSGGGKRLNPNRSDGAGRLAPSSGVQHAWDYPRRGKGSRLNGTVANARVPQGAA